MRDAKKAVEGSLKEVKVTIASVCVIVLLGVVLYLSDEQLFTRINWIQQNVLHTVDCYRYSVIASQLLFLGLACFSARKAKMPKTIAVITGIVVILGFVLSILGWLRVDSLLQDLTLI